ncbi:hypothetical protein QT989_32810, partial [Microcoleus sp. SVA1_B6]
FLILVLLITLTFRSSDYITIFFGSHPHYFLPESLLKNKAGIECGEIIVLFLDECHLLHGDLTGYVWGQSKIRIEVPITNEKDRQTYFGTQLSKQRIPYSEPSIW